LPGTLDPDAPLREPVRIGNRYPATIRPLTTIRHLIAFAHIQAEKEDDQSSSDWQRVYEELLRAETPLDVTMAVAHFKATADERRWLGR
jgi:hypothetical protein